MVFNGWREGPELYGRSHSAAAQCSKVIQRIPISDPNYSTSSLLVAATPSLASITVAESRCCEVNLYIIYIYIHIDTCSHIYIYIYIYIRMSTHIETGQQTAVWHELVEHPPPVGCIGSPGPLSICLRQVCIYFYLLSTLYFCFFVVIWGLLVIFSLFFNLCI